MTGSIQRRVSPITGKVTYRVRVFVGQREGGVGDGAFGGLVGPEPPARGGVEGEEGVADDDGLVGAVAGGGGRYLRIGGLFKSGHFYGVCAIGPGGGVRTR